jgi:hypothetical protein
MITTDVTLTGMTIDWETADRITKLNLIEYRNGLQEHLDKGMAGETYLHSDDEKHNRAMIQAIDFVLKDFGEN